MDLTDRIASLSPEGRALLERLLDDEALSMRDLESYQPPRTDVEHALAQIFAQVLQCERVGVSDNFFELGGDSVLCIQILARARKQGYALTSQDLFAYPTVGQLAARLQVAAGATPVAAATRYRLTPLQQGMLFHTLRAGDGDAYVSRFHCMIHGHLERSLLARAWQDAIERHPVLRSAFEAGDAEPLQVVHPEATLELGFEDWRTESAAACSQRHDALLAREAARRFDLARPPLMHLQLVQLADDSHWCLWSHHHLILDGWSQQVLLREVFERYEALAAGRPAPVNAPCVPFSAFVEHVHARDGDPEQAAYWRGRLAGLSVSALAPLGVAPQAGAPMESVGQAMDGARWSAVTALARRARVTPQCVLQGAWALALRQSRDWPALVYGLTTTGRSAPLEGIEHVLGVLINTVPVRVDFAPGMALADWLAALQHEQGRLQHHEHSSPQQIRRAAGFVPDTPLFDSILVYQGIAPGFTVRQIGGGLTLDALAFSVAEDYPLVLVATPGTDLQLEMKYQAAHVPRQVVSALLATLVALLEVFIETPQATLPQCEAAALQRLREQAHLQHRQRRRRNRERLLERARVPAR